MRPQTAKCHDPPACVASRHNLGPPASSRRPRRTTMSRRIGSSPPSPSRPPPLSRRLISTAVEPPWPSAARLPSPSHRLGFGRESPPPESRLHRRRRPLCPEPALYCNYHCETSCQAPPHSANRARRFKSSTRLRFAKASCRTRSPLHRRTNPPFCAAFTFTSSGSRVAAAVPSGSSATPRHTHTLSRLTRPPWPRAAPSARFAPGRLGYTSGSQTRRDGG